MNEISYLCKYCTYALDSFHSYSLYLWNFRVAHSYKIALQAVEIMLGQTSRRDKCHEFLGSPHQVVSRVRYTT
jgi:transposase-like protein